MRDGGAVPDALIDLLDRERDAILAGRFDILERLVTEKERLAGGLAGQSGTAPTLSMVKRKSDRNAGLLEAMQRGVRAAIGGLEAARNGPAPLATYSETGQRTTMTGGRPTMQRRA